MKKKLLSILLSLAMVITMMPAMTLSVSAKTKTSTTVSTQKGLNKALKNTKLRTISVKTAKAKNFTVPKGTHKKVHLVVDATKSTVKNKSVFKKITIKGIKSDTNKTAWTEYNKGNTLIVHNKTAKIAVAKSATVKEIIVLEKDSNINFNVTGTLKKVTVEESSTITINGSSKKTVEVNIKNEDSVVKVINNTDTIVKAKDSNGKVVEVKTDSTEVIGGHTPSPTPTPNPPAPVLTPVDAPTAATGLNYNGTEQTGVAEATGYNVTNGKATGAGSYTATATLADGYKWSDGTTAAKQIEWSIAKVALTATADDKSVFVGYEAPNYTVTYTGWVNGESIETVMPTTAAELACEYTTTSTVGEYDITFTTAPEFANYSVTTVNGKLTAVDPTQTYTVTFDLQGLNVNSETKPAPIGGVSYGSTITEPAPEPAAAGHVFDGWYKEAECTNAWNFDSDTVTEDTTLYARWTINSYNVAAQVQDSHGTATVKVNNEEVSSAAYASSVVYSATADAGYEFDYWEVVLGGIDIDSVKNNATITVTMPANALTIKAHFKVVVPDTYSIIVENDGHGTAKAQVESADVTSAAPNATVTLVTTANDGYVFKAWQITSGLASDAITDNSFTMPSNEVKIKAVFEREYTVTFNLNDKTGTAPTAQTVVSGGKVTEPTPAPTTTGYTFVGWYKDGSDTAWNFDSDIVTEDTILYAEWKPKKFNITYKDEGDQPFTGINSEVLPKEHTYGTVTYLINAERADCYFVGWFTDSGCISNAVTQLGETAIDADITLYAKWRVVDKDEVKMDISTLAAAKKEEIGRLVWLSGNAKQEYYDAIDALVTTAHTAIDAAGSYAGVVSAKSTAQNALLEQGINAGEADTQAKYTFKSNKKEEVEAYASEQIEVIDSMGWLTGENKKSYTTLINEIVDGEAERSIESAINPAQVDAAVSAAKCEIDAIIAAANDAKITQAGAFIMSFFGTMC